MRRYPWLSILILIMICGTTVQAGGEAPMLGFSADGAQEQRKLEEKFDSQLNNDDLRQWMKRLSARPHHVGSPYDKDNVEFIASLFKSWGFATEIEEFGVLFPTPKTRLLEMTAPTSYVANLEEPALAEDSTSDQKDEQLPPYNAYSIDGDVAGELVYVNYGIPGDYEELERRGIDVKGKIVIARYGGSWRGIKPKVAAEKGAIGCILYSDPIDDGYYAGDVYPKGAYKNEHGAQRGSVVDMPLYPGDPLTPEIGAVEGAKRLDIKDAPSLTKIPVLPISYANALPLLQALEGPVAPKPWRGALPITYHLGPGPAQVHLKVEFNWDIEPALDVIARIEGRDRPEQWIIRGNHHDAWVNGAKDPLSGLVAMLAEARALGELVKSGWRPRRTIIYCAWGAEEPGLLGSTEWVETHADLLREHAAVYVNSDSNGRGFFRANGSHTLEKFVNQVAREVIDPATKISVSDRLRALRLVKSSGKERRELWDRADLRIGALGSGSDYSPFLQFLGVASLDVRFGGEDGHGSYHSIYDSFDHFTRFIDPNFDYGVTLAKAGGRLVLRLANADVLPFDFAAFTDTVSNYIGEVVKLTEDKRKETEETNRLIREGRYGVAADPTKILHAPKAHPPVPYLNFAPLHNAFDILKDSSDRYEKARQSRTQSGELLTDDQQKALDRILYQSEQKLTLAEGLPRRSWFKHQIYAPGFYTGYGVKTLPGVREAIEQRDWKEAGEQIVIVGRTLERFADQIDRAAQVLAPDEN